MRDLPADLALHLALEATTLCRCWRARRRDGQVFGFTDHDEDLAFDGTVFRAATGLEAAEASAELGFAVGGGEVAGALSGAGLSEADLLAGRWDEAEVETFLVNWRAPGERVLLAVGEIGEVRRQGQAFTAELREPAHRLDVVAGRLFATACDARLGDARCGVDLSDPAYRASGAVDAVESGFAFTATGLGGVADGWFTGGSVNWTSGANAGAAVGVREHRRGTPDRIALWRAPPSAPAPGDGFDVTAGCDKRFETCRGKFGNVANFRGFPHIPGTDRVLSYPSPDGEHDGGSLVR